MSHNIHFLRLEAEDHKSAMEEAELLIEDWGTDNNWRSFLYSICQDGTIYDPQGDCPPFEQVIEEITTGLTAVVNSKPSSPETLTTLLAQMTVLIAQGKSYKEIVASIGMKGIYHLRYLSIELLSNHRINIIDDKIDPWTTKCRDWELNEYGITELSTPTEGSDEKTYIVVIDMHD